MTQKKEREEALSTMVNYMVRWGDLNVLEEARVRTMKRLAKEADMEVVAAHCGVSIRTAYRLRALKVDASIPIDGLLERFKRMDPLRRDRIFELARLRRLQTVTPALVDLWLELLQKLKVVHTTHAHDLYSLTAIEPKQVTLAEALKGNV